LRGLECNDVLEYYSMKEQEKRKTIGMPTRKKRKRLTLDYTRLDLMIKMRIYIYI
jgi:hypothetical protein